MDSPTTVAEGRAQIDALDAELADLVRRRMEVSRAVQRLRQEAGVPGVQHARENEVLARYRQALGDPGGRLGLLVLKLCRGDVPTPRAEDPAARWRVGLTG